MFVSRELWKTRIRAIISGCLAFGKADVYISFTHLAQAPCGCRSSVDWLERLANATQGPTHTQLQRPVPFFEPLADEAASALTV